jgi:2-oxoglutarate ferredoxin oxidoreductase subunit alpha
MTNTKKEVIIDDSRVIMEALARAGADVYIGYPITPSNAMYLYASQRFKYMLPAPDEISTLQYMSGMSIAGYLPVTATSFPGFALMVESINMAYMMELPMVIILTQRLGPATGTATAGAQGDVLLLRGMISGGHPIPVFCPSSIEDAWMLSAKALEFAVKVRTPVVILSSKERSMTNRNFDISKLPPIHPVERKFYDKDSTYLPYEYNESLVPEFLPITTNKHQIRLTASTHDQKGIIQHTSDEAMRNTVRLEKKIYRYINDYTYYDYVNNGSDSIIVSYGISANAAQQAVIDLSSNGKKVDLLIVKTMLPVPNVLYEILEKYKKIVFAEDNINGQYAKIMYGDKLPDKVKCVGAIGKMLSPLAIIEGGQF